MLLIKRITIVLICLLSLTAHGQKCKFAVDKTDPFSNEKVRSSEHHIGPPTWNWRITLEQNGENFYVSLQIVLSGQVAENIEKGKIIYLKLENGDVVQLEADREYAAAYTAANGMVFTSYVPRFQVDQTVIIQLSKSPITDYKYTTMGKDILLPKISDKQTKKIMETANCLLQ